MTYLEDMLCVVVFAGLAIWLYFEHIACPECYMLEFMCQEHKLY